MKRLSWLLILALVVGLTTGLVSGPVLAMSGSGTLGDPYIITTPTDLQSIANDLSAYYELGGSINMSGVSYTPPGYGDDDYGEYVYMPVGDVDIHGSWTVYPAAPATCWDKVDEGASPDYNSTYIQSQDDGDYVLFQMDSFNISTDAVDIGVYIVSFGTRMGASGLNVSGYLRLEGGNYAFDSGGDYVAYPAWTTEYYHDTDYQNPKTGQPWTAAEANAIQGFGLIVNDSTADLRLTTISIDIWWRDAFTGHLDGKGYTISNLDTIAGATDGKGVFGDMWEATVTNLTLSSFNISSGSLVGALAGRCSYSNITDVTATGYITGSGTGYSVYGGGLVGTSSYSAINRTATYCVVDVTGSGSSSTATAGGLVALSYGNNISRSYALGPVNCTATSYAYAGGLLGGDSSATPASLVNQCFAVGNVYATTSHATRRAVAGGFVGSANSNWLVTDCYGRGNATAVGVSVGYAGGWVGYALTFSASNTTNCYSTGYVDGSSADGGFVGFEVAPSEIDDSSCFWDTETSGTNSSSSGTGKTTAQMKTQSTFTSAGWDFVNVWSIDGTETLNDGYPYFAWTYPPPVYPGDYVQVQWFQPNAIIVGTTLPDRMGNQNGVFSWGTNPAGINITMSQFYSDYQNPTYILPQDAAGPSQDMLGPTGNPGWTTPYTAHTGNPFYWLVNLAAQAFNVPIVLMWPILAWLIVLIVMGICYVKAPHQFITAVAGGGLTAYFYSAGIFQFWELFIFGALCIAVLVKEITPQPT